jgi:hypothetical protein
LFTLGEQSVHQAGTAVKRDLQSGYFHDVHSDAHDHAVKPATAGPAVLKAMGQER